MKKVDAVLNSLGKNSDEKYHLIIGNYFGTKEYGFISKVSELTENIKDFVKDEGNGRHNISVTLHKTPEGEAIAQSDLQVTIEFSIKEV